MTLHILSCVKGTYHSANYYSYGTYNATHFSGYITDEKVQQLVKAYKPLALNREYYGIKETLYKWTTD